jgi:hypothetical protein
VGSWNCKRLTAADIIVASSLQLLAPLKVNRLAGNSSGISDVSLCEGNARMCGVCGNRHAMDGGVKCQRPLMCFTFRQRRRKKKLLPTCIAYMFRE